MISRIHITPRGTAELLARGMTHADMDRLRVSLHTGPVAPDTMRVEDGAEPPTVDASRYARPAVFTTLEPITASFLVIGEAVVNLGEVLGQINPEPFERLAEWAEAHGVDEWPDAEDDHYDGMYVGYDDEGTGVGDPLAEVRGLSYDQTLAEIDARLKGE